MNQYQNVRPLILVLCVSWVCMGILSIPLFSQPSQALPLNQAMPTFTNIAPGLGINTKIDIYGPNLADYNNDGRLDLMFTNHNKLPLALYKQQSSSQVTDVATSVNINPNGDMHGAAWGDCDGDGRLDLYISLGVFGGDGSNPKRLYRQLANGTFVDVAAQAGVADEFGRGRSASWVDYDNDGDLDLFTGNAPREDGKVSYDKLFRNNGDCTFTNRTGQAGNLAASNHWHGPSWADYDNDGDMDVFITSWQTPRLADLYRNNGDGTFSLVSASAGVINEAYRGMAWGDYDNDGDMDLFAACGYNTNDTNPGQTNRLYRNNGNGTFTEVGVSAGVAQSRNSQHAMWADFNNDGYLDLFVINAGDVHTGNKPDFLYMNKGNGTFQEVGAAVGATGSSQGLGGGGAVGDFNADGFMDIVITNGENGGNSQFYGPHQLLRNGGNTNHWLQIKLVGQQSNSLGIGARVELITVDGLYQMREMNGGVHHFSQNEMLVHFGLGQRGNIAKVTVRWPSGLVQQLTNVTVDQRLTVVETGEPEGDPIPTSIPLPPSPVILYLSLANNGPYAVGAAAEVRDEDILSFDGSNFAMYFDGSDVGLQALDLDAFYIVDRATILISFQEATTIGDLGLVDDSDILQFKATSLGPTTVGTLSLFFDGSDVDLTTDGEDVDAIEVLADGRLLISTVGGVSVPGVSAVDEDLLAFTPASLGNNTSGTWAMYFDGSDVGLATDADEAVDGVDVGVDGNIYLSTRANFSVPGRSGANEDVFVCIPTSLGNNTACSFPPTLFFDGSIWGLASNDVDAINRPDPPSTGPGSDLPGYSIYLPFIFK